MQIHVVPVAWHSHKETLRRIRETVFIVEQQVPREIEWDGEDDNASHFLAINEAGQALGCARLLPSGQIGRMAVLPEYRGRGLGQRLLSEAVEEAKRQGMPSVHLHAQAHAVGFYRKAGFLPEGGEFLEAGIAHQAMALELPIPFEPPPDVPKAVLRPDNAEDPVQSRVEHYRGERDCMQGLVDSLAQPRRKLAILSQQLDHTLFDTAAVAESLSHFARSSPSVEVRILISDASLIVSRGHRLVELARRLDSRIEIRRIADELSPGERSFLTWDARGFFLLPDFRDYLALADIYDPVRARRLLEDFDYLWERSTADPELRILRI